VTLNDTREHRKLFSKYHVRSIDSPRMMGQTGVTYLKPGVDRELVVTNYPIPQRLRRKAQSIAPIVRRPTLPKPKVAFFTEIFSPEELWEQWAKPKIDEMRERAQDTRKDDGAP